MPNITYLHTGYSSAESGKLGHNLLSGHRRQQPSPILEQIQSNPCYCSTHHLRSIPSLSLPPHCVLSRTRPGSLLNKCWNRKSSSVFKCFKSHAELHAKVTLCQSAGSCALGLAVHTHSPNLNTHLRFHFLKSDHLLFPHGNIIRLHLCK